MTDFLCKHSSSSKKHRSPAITRPGCYAAPLRGAARRALLAARVADLAFTTASQGTAPGASQRARRRAGRSVVDAMSVAREPRGREGVYSSYV